MRKEALRIILGHNPPPKHLEVNALSAYDRTNDMVVPIVVMGGRWGFNQSNLGRVESQSVMISLDNRAADRPALDEQGPALPDGRFNCQGRIPTYYLPNSNNEMVTLTDLSILIKLVFGENPAEKLYLNRRDPQSRDFPLDQLFFWAKEGAHRYLLVLEFSSQQVARHWRKQLDEGQVIELICGTDSDWRWPEGGRQPWKVVVEPINFGYSITLPDYDSPGKNGVTITPHDEFDINKLVERLASQ